MDEYNECEVWVTTDNDKDFFIVGGLTAAQALIVCDNIEYAIDVQAFFKKAER